MPSPYIKKLAKDTGKPVSELERYWKKAKEITKDDFNVSENDFTDKHYAYATGIVKNMAGVKEAIITVRDFIQSGKSANDFINEVVASGNFPALDKGTVSKKKDDDEMEEEKTSEVNEEIKEESKQEDVPIVEMPDPKMVEIVNGYYTENGVMLEALDKNGNNYFLKFESKEDAQENGFEFSDDMII